MSLKFHCRVSLVFDENKFKMYVPNHGEWEFGMGDGRISFPPQVGENQKPLR